jgi:NAD-dependent SIR2 family protein deacetylase
MSNEQDVYQRAAEAISKAKFLLIATGAGHSACSKLPVYNDIANVPVYKKLELSYHDLARPVMLDDEENEADISLFYGFWCKCIKQYSSTVPHEGYNILKKWNKMLNDKMEDDIKDSLIQKQKEFLNTTSDDLAQSMFIYTSNVDSHFTRMFPNNMIYEIHGNVFDWQCTDLDCADKNGIWRFPEDQIQTMVVDEDTMTVKDESNMSVFRCVNCHKLTRPNVLLFGDTTWKLHSVEENTYVSWECAVETILKDSKSDASENTPYPFVVLEIGCGLRVPEVRLECENVVRDTFGSSILIRINAIEEHAKYLDDQSLAPHTISIQDTSLHALQEIDNYLQRLVN